MIAKPLLKLTLCSAAAVIAVQAHAASYSISELNYPGASRTAAYGINNSVQVVGHFGPDAPNDYAFVYNNNIFGSYSAPGAAPAYGGTYFSGISNNGRMIGTYFDTSSFHAFQYNNGTYTVIDSIGGPVNSNSSITLKGINNSGLMVGNYSGSEASYGFVYDGATAVALGAPGAAYTAANGINDSGQIVGYFSDNLGTHGYLYSGDSYTVFDAPGASSTLFLGINNNGEMLGTFSDNGGTHYFLYSDGIYNNIALLGINNFVLTGLNDNGQLTGWFSKIAGNTSSFIASPVPVPAAIWMFGSGLLGVAGLKRYRFRKC
jgi:probable HAF family extracellular repeat protein